MQGQRLFFFTEEDVANILLPHTAFENLVTTEDQGNDIKGLFSEEQWNISS